MLPVDTRKWLPLYCEEIEDSEPIVLHNPGWYSQLRITVDDGFLKIEMLDESAP